MISRSNKKLQAAKKAVLDHVSDNAKPVQIVTEEHDFSKFTDIDQYQKRFDPIFKAKDVAVLINNAGQGTSGPLDRLSAAEVCSMAAVNLIHPVFLSKVAVDHMANRDNKSLIMNVGSVMEQHPSAGFSVYSCTKAFIHHFTKSVSQELQQDPDLNGKIDFMLYSPGFVSTKLNGMPYIPMLIPTPLQAAKGALTDCVSLGADLAKCK